MPMASRVCQIWQQEDQRYVDMEQSTKAASWAQGCTRRACRWSWPAATPQRQRVLTFLAFVGFGLSAWIMTNAFYIELGVFQQVLPEKYSISAYAIFALQSANIYPFVYMLVNAREQYVRQQRVIWVLLVLGVVGAVLMSTSWMDTARIAGHEHSIAMLVLTHLTGVVGATSNVVFFPYVAQFLPVFTSALSTGEGLSGSLVALLGLLQQPYSEHPRFSVSTFYAVCVVITAISLLAFAFLEMHPWAASQHATAAADSRIKVDRKPSSSRHGETDPLVPHSSSATIDLSVSSTQVQIDQQAPQEQSTLRLVGACLLYQLVLAAFAFGLLPSLMPFVYKKYAPLNDVQSSTARYQTIATVLALVFDPVARILTSRWRLYRVHEMTIALCVIGSFLTSAAFIEHPMLSTTAHGYILPIAAHVTYLVGFAYTQTMLFFASGRIIKSSPSIDANRVYQWSGFATQLGAFLSTVAIFPLVFFREDLFL